MINVLSEVRMGSRPHCDFGRVIRTRRRELHLTLREVARRTKRSAALIVQFESGARMPSDETLAMLASSLRLDTRQLFLLARPETAELLRPDGSLPGLTTWDAFRKNEALHRANKITAEEMDFLSKVAKLGDVKSERDFLFVVITVRHAIDRFRGHHSV